MNMTTTTKAGPAIAEPAPSQVLAQALRDTTSIPRTAIPRWAATALEHAHAVVVDLGEGRSRRRVFFSLPSAERALARAQDRGHDAVLVLVRLVVAGEEKPS